MNPEQLLDQYLQERHMMQLATVAGDQPWCCTVYFVVDEERNVYWASLSSRRHSQEISRHGKVAIAIPVKFVKGESVVGVQMAGTATVLESSPEIQPIAEKYAAKFGRDAQWIADFTSGKTEHKLYKFTPSEIQVFDEANFPDEPLRKI